MSTITRAHKSGICTFDLGANNYTVVAEVGEIFGLRDKLIVELQENRTTSVELHPTQLVLLSGEEILLFVIVVITFLFALVCVFVLIKKYQNRPIIPI